jgi:hypothetical protein
VEVFDFVDIRVSDSGWLVAGDGRWVAEMGEREESKRERGEGGEFGVGDGKGKVKWGMMLSIGGERVFWQGVGVGRT